MLLVDLFRHVVLAHDERHGHTLPREHAGDRSPKVTAPEHRHAERGARDAAWAEALGLVGRGPRAEHRPPPSRRDALRRTRSRRMAASSRNAELLLPGSRERC